MPVAGSSVILALDVSGSMCATDVDPNRLSAAQAAVRDFVKAQDSSTRIGLVVFSGFAQLAVAPTTERDELLRAIDSLTTGRGTTIGAAILESVDAIAQIDPNVAPGDDTRPDRRAPGGRSGAADPGPRPGSYAPGDRRPAHGRSEHRGVTPVEAAKIAASRGVRVYPIGFGTSQPTALVVHGRATGR